jgi:hypothetical protein
MRMPTSMELRQLHKLVLHLPKMYVNLDTW